VFKIKSVLANWRHRERHTYQRRQRFSEWSKCAQPRIVEIARARIKLQTPQVLEARHMGEGINGQGRS
jgi:hypothetical protein